MSNDERSKRKIRNRIRDKNNKFNYEYKNNTFGNCYLSAGSESGHQGEWWKIYYPKQKRWRKIKNLKKYCRITNLKYQWILDQIKIHDEVKLNDGKRIRKIHNRT